MSETIHQQLAIITFLFGIVTGFFVHGILIDTMAMRRIKRRIRGEAKK